MEYIVTTPCGKLRGTETRVDGIVAYKGIRYATAGRFEYPREVTSWEGIYDATEYGACAYQARAFCDEEQMPKKIFYYNEFRRGERYIYSEDCLFLNVFTPKEKGERLPVIIYIHGGSFTGGCGHEKHFDIPLWPTRGVIGVTINYRLGPLGFAVLPELKAEAGKTGNYGLYDQLTAINWVRHNIAAFGGDPDNITVMGQSAGAMSVQQHCLSPLTRGLFHKAVMSSGGGVSRMLAAASPEKHYAFWQMIMEKCGARTLDEVRSIPVEKLYAVWQDNKKASMGGGCSPCVDGELAPRQEENPSRTRVRSTEPTPTSSLKRSTIISHPSNEKNETHKAAFCRLLACERGQSGGGYRHRSRLSPHSARGERCLSQGIRLGYRKGSP